jgi:histidinol dehydrogenase
MLSVLDLRGFTGDLRSRLPRPSIATDAPVAAVREILAAVKQRGDAALRELTERFDGVVLDDLVPVADLAAARSRCADVSGDRGGGGIADFRWRKATESSYARDGIVVRTIPVPVDRAVATLGGRRCIRRPC